MGYPRQRWFKQVLDDNDRWCLSIEWWEIPPFEVKLLVNFLIEIPPLDKRMSGTVAICYATGWLVCFCPLARLLIVFAYRARRVFLNCCFVDGPLPHLSPRHSTIQLRPHQAKMNPLYLTVNYLILISFTNGRTETPT